MYSVALFIFCLLSAFIFFDVFFFYDIAWLQIISLNRPQHPREFSPLLQVDRTTALQYRIDRGARIAGIAKKNFV